MDTLHGGTQHLHGNESKVAASTRLLIQHGLDSLLHGNNIEGISLLVQAHARLASEKTHIATLLETTIEACARYNKAQEAILNAGRDYAKAEAEQQAQLNILTDILATQDAGHGCSIDNHSIASTSYSPTRGTDDYSLNKQLRQYTAPVLIHHHNPKRSSTSTLHHLLWPVYRLARRRLAGTLP